MKQLTRSLTLALGLGVITACAQTQAKESNDGMTSKESATKESTAASQAAMRPESDRYKQPGFAVFEEDGRLWVFQESSEAHADFVAKGEPAKRVTLVGVGPEGKTLMGADRKTLNAYLGGSNP